jgi:hypothetical protein
MKRPNKIPKEVLPYIEHLEKELGMYKKTPYVKSYLTIYNQLEDFNDQLTLRRKKDAEGKEYILGRIDLFASKDDKSFDRTKWYFDKILELNKNLDELRKLMTPAEIKELTTAKPLLEGSAESYLRK